MAEQLPPEFGVKSHFASHNVFELGGEVAPTSSQVAQQAHRDLRPLGLLVHLQVSEKMQNKADSKLNCYSTILSTNKAVFLAQIKP